MSGIVTLTMNPAIDTYLSGESLHRSKIRCHVTGCGPGGGGINVARVMCKLGGDARALVAVGGARGARLLGMLDERGMRHRETWVEQETRDTFIVFERESKHRYHIITDGPTLYEAEWRRALDFVEELVADGCYLVMSGSLPPGVPDDFYARAAALAKARGCRVAVDTSGEPLAAVLREGVWLVKPNRRELVSVAGHELATMDDRARVVERLVQRGAAEVVAATFGPEGSLIATATERWAADPPPIEPQSEVGAGDSFLGALVLALSRDWPLSQGIAFAVAAAGSALSRSGPGLSQREETERLFAQINASGGVRPA